MTTKTRLGLLVSLVFSFTQIVCGADPNWVEIRKGNWDSAKNIPNKDFQIILASLDLIEHWVREKHTEDADRGELEKTVNTEVDSMVANRTQEEILTMGKMLCLIKANEHLENSLSSETTNAKTTIKLMLNGGDWRLNMTALDAGEKFVQYTLARRNETHDLVSYLELLHSKVLADKKKAAASTDDNTKHTDAEKK